MFLQRLAASDSGASPKRGDSTANLTATKPTIPLAQAGDNTLASFFNSLLKVTAGISSAKVYSDIFKKDNSASRPAAMPSTEAPSQRESKTTPGGGGENVAEQDEEEESDLSPAESTPRDSDDVGIKKP